MQYSFSNEHNHSGIANHIDESIRIFLTKNVDSVILVTPAS